MEGCFPQEWSASGMAQAGWQAGGDAGDGLAHPAASRMQRAASAPAQHLSWQGGDALPS
ncbi:hypothetical protein C2E20_2610 [Micractinium conductrix]|uniref:Uncharacterized protein n=1 Tax=Micractinium conductrix TaxID=554055 RepID=A0A2P6VIW9_9CHLO|nr:hypothetical protein C2E20_2610 [Micractinium conductrix]|eukprot:PSC74022.1 hypothetical protein C2E20_2610 [Micractinium conductrix]